MKSSNIEDIFKYKPAVEESKSLLPLTYYQPFQSSFDPDFGTSPKTVQDSPQPAMRRWNQRMERQPGQVPTWVDGSRGGYRQSRPGPGCSVPPGFGSSGRNYPPPPPPWSVFPNPRQCVGYVDPTPKYVPDGSFGTFAAYPTHSVYGPASSRPGYGYGGPFGCGPFSGPSQQPLVKYPDAVHAPVCYPLVVGSFEREVTKTSPRSGHNRPMICNFCRNNKEVPDIYLNHYLYDPETKVLTCPVLRKHVCEVCGGTGDKAHTLQYCPVNKERGLQAKIPVLLKARTITNSTGKIRRN